ncbi:MAG: SDR family oxidoreductase, partial [Deltaproteobacteria bacterium]|nr:SDR family oxidoreductase [Nannocystaceae bacterium]
CTAHELAALGAHVVLVGRKPERLAAVVAEIIEDGGAASSEVCDIREEARVVACVQAIVAARGRIDALVNNAGGQFPSPLALINQKGFETVVRTNLIGGFLFARECFTQSLREHGGAIVNIVADFWNGMPGMGHSGAARAGMDNFTKTAALEWAAAGVRVNAVAPGWVASSGLDTYEGPVKQMIPKLREAVPLKRLATEAEISAGIVFLLSEAAAFITGETLKIDGGAPLFSALWPSPDHDRSQPFQGFHRASTPKVLERVEDR